MAKDASTKTSDPKSTTTRKAAAKEATAAENGKKAATASSAAKKSGNTTKKTDTTTKKATATKKGTTTSSKTASRKDNTAGGTKSTANTKKTTTTKKSTSKKSAPARYADIDEAWQQISEKVNAEERASAKKQAPSDEAHDATEAAAVTQANTSLSTDVKPPVHLPNKKRKRVLMLLLFLLLAAAILLISCLIYLYRPTAYTEKTTAINFVYLPATNQTQVFVNGDLRGVVVDELIEKEESARGNVCVAKIGNTLYLVKGRDVLYVADNVSDFTLATGGNIVAYRIGNDLYYRATKENAQATLITPYAYDRHYCLSPDGRELAYTWLDPDSDVVKMNVESYSANKPQIEETARMFPIAVSDNCRFIYYTDEEGALFIYDAQNSRAVACGKPDEGSLIFNRTFTELMLTQNNTTSFFAESHRKLLMDDLPSDRFSLIPNQRAAVQQKSYGAQYFVETFYGNYFVHITEKGQYLMYMNEKGEMQELTQVDDISTVTVTDKGTFFLLTNPNGENTSTVLYCYETVSAPAVTVMWDVRNYCANANGSKVLYTDKQNTLYVYDGETERLCDNILPDTVQVSADDLFCFYRAAGVLCVSDNGNEPRELQSGVTSKHIFAHTLFYITDVAEDGSFTVYANHRNARKSDLVSVGATRLD